MNGHRAPEGSEQVASFSKPVSAMTEWAEATLLAARRLGVSASPEAVRRSGAWSPNLDPEQEVLGLVRSAGLTGAFVPVRPSAVTRVLLPFLMEMDDCGILVVVDLAPDGGFIADYSIAGTTLTRHVSLASLGDAVRRLLVLQPAVRVLDARISDYVPKADKNWLRDVFTNNRKLLAELCAGSLFGNLLALATTLFTMQVWDRAVPARSLNTLWVLALGVALALVMEFLLRIARASITDNFGKKADLDLSDLFYARLVDIRNDARPRSPGSLIAQIRDFEQVRELLTSTAFGVLIDIPFVFLFIAVMALLGGWLAIIPLVAVPLIIIPGLIAQRRLARLSTEGMAESALRNALLMETVYRVEDIKNLQAETRFRGLWRMANQRSGEISLHQRHIALMLVTFSSTTMNLAYIGVIIAGVYGVLFAGLSTGTVIACSMLTSRALSPLAQIPAALARFQNAKVAKQGLDNLLALPTDHDLERDRKHKPALIGQYRFDKIQYAYGPEDGIAIDIPALAVEPGERIAVLGRTGAGKSTFLRLLGNMATPQGGRITLDETPLDLIDIADVRRNVGYMLQDSSLFYGSLRENLVLGAPLADDHAIERALKISCADRLLLGQPHGLDRKLRESGAGLSGGQKQVLMLARMILREPNILLLDEPTASLDEGTERDIIRNLDEWLGRRTLIVATHRHSLLSIVTRVIVIEGGKIVLDAPRDEALAQLSRGMMVPASGAMQKEAHHG